MAQIDHLATQSQLGDIAPQPVPKSGFWVIIPAEIRNLIYTFLLEYEAGSDDAQLPSVSKSESTRKVPASAHTLHLRREQHSKTLGILAKRDQRFRNEITPLARAYALSATQVVINWTWPDQQIVHYVEFAKHKFFEWLIKHWTQLKLSHPQKKTFALWFPGPRNGSMTWIGVPTSCVRISQTEQLPHEHEIVEKGYESIVGTLLCEQAQTFEEVLSTPASFTVRFQSRPYSQDQRKDIHILAYERDRHKQARHAAEGS